MTKVYLVRHGEAEGNVYRRIHGQYNSTLTKNGRKQLEALKDRFASIHLDAAYSSDLYRAHETALAVCRDRGLEVIQDPRLREVGMGQWEDLPWAEAMRLNPEQSENFTFRHLQWQVDGSEPYQDAADRFFSAVAEHAADHDGETIAIFAHGSVIRTFLCLASGRPLTELHKVFHSDNTAVSLVEMDGDEVNILFENDNSHLPEEISTLARQSWWKKHQAHRDLNLWYRPMDLNQSEALYMRAREDAFSAIYQTLDGFNGPGFLSDARDLAMANPNWLSACMLKDEQVGILQLDPRETKDALWIAFFYMMPEYRNQRMGTQLLGQAISTCRNMDRLYLRLRVSDRNESARRFYERHGFQVIGQEQGVHSQLHIMEQYIGF